MQNISTQSVHLPGLIDRIRAAVARGLDDAQTAVLVAESLRPALGLPDLLTEAQRQHSTQGYRQHVLYVEPSGSFSVVALVWLPGQSTPIHDHVSWCAAGVHEGAETEIRYRVAGSRGRRHLVAADHRVNRPGDICGIAPPGDIHQVSNSGTSTAISLHVYGADIHHLGSSIHRCYDLPPD